jgi:hypothetical protein
MGSKYRALSGSVFIVDNALAVTAEMMIRLVVVAHHGQRNRNTKR